MKPTHWFILLALVVIWSFLAGSIAWCATQSFSSAFMWMAIVAAFSFLMLIIIFSMAIAGNSVFNQK